MPAVCSELQKSRRLVAGKSAEFFYIVGGTPNEADALAAVLATAPTSYSFPAPFTVTLPRTAPEVEPVWVSDTDGLWEARVVYQSEAGPPPQENESSFSFDTTGGTQHVTQSLSTAHKYPANEAPDFQGAIEYDGERVTGCDITVPVYKFSETHFKAPAFVTTGYKNNVMQLTGKVNNGSFKGFDAGEVLFLGVSGARRGTHTDDLWELSFSFAVSPNRTNLTVGPITGIVKNGWQYLWVLYEDHIDENAKVRVKKPKAVFVENVYETASFSGLGI